MKSWIEALSRTRAVLRDLACRALGARAPDARAIEELEAALIQVDVPPRLAAELAPGLLARNGADPSPLARPAALLAETLSPQQPFGWRRDIKPLVVLIVGVNGSGKTTTAAKLAWMVKQGGLTPLMAAADTFRAAGAEQLRIWAERVGCEIVAGRMGSDAAAVAYDAVAAARARRSDVVLIDTAGRMHTKKNLMAELQKIRRSIDKALPGAPHESWLVCDATSGHNAVVQARVFHDAVTLSGLIVAKLDGSAKAGFVLAVDNELHLPIRFVGLGEAREDLAPFDPSAFAEALLSGPDDMR